jgi:hypothetical protein
LNPDHNGLQQLGDYLMLYLLAKNLSPLILKVIKTLLYPKTTQNYSKIFSARVNVCFALPSHCFLDPIWFRVCRQAKMDPLKLENLKISFSKQLSERLELRYFSLA